jgi:hypothetical protein
MKLKPITRTEVPMEQWEKTVAELQSLVPTIRKEAGPGVFIHPHEILGCMADQQAKLTAAVSASMYSADVSEVRKRLLKLAYAALFGAASLDIISE